MSTESSCPNCGFRFNCICHAQPTLHSRGHFILLTHDKEFGKATNTGQLMARSLSGCQQIRWSRTEPPQALLDLLADDTLQPWLLFPADDQHPAVSFQAATDKKPLFILLDATWQEARKMVRKSPWLACLPRLSLQPEQLSGYALRRNQQPGHLCTCETGIALLTLLDEPHQAAALQHYFDAFLHIFHAEQSGHKR
ncbi:DTW domain-containing protein [Photobacterium sp. GJ3]|uniref:tRNA-uridine aminocarboxypropyltransferase n=1 Tax=Photobacterium sp. GJ3 TaxID=2829502 RepID=UPI001B8D77D7|nr:DTW domain-containing protein [Photobacterium sp. GJ3]QUJ67362.1 DTW domain-containing protein [Photobacterium sp. GJ3]